MNIIEHLSKKFEEEIRSAHKDDVNFYPDTQYLTIENGKEIKISPYTYYMEDADVCIVICKYSYKVITAYDRSFFIQFIDKYGWSKDHYKMGDWILSLDRPLTSDNRTYDSRDCEISNGILRVKLEVKVSGICEQMKLLWGYFLKMQECKSQKELDLLKLCFSKDVAIQELTDWNQNICYEKAVSSATMNAYKEVLDKIEKTVRGY